MFMRKPICSVCGRPAVIESLCEEHYSKRNELFSVEPFKIEMCDTCEAVRDDYWVRIPLEEVVESIIRRNAQGRNKLDDVSVKLKKGGEGFIATIKATGHILPATIEKTETKEVRIRVKTLKCPICVKMLGRYHEAVIQFRGPRMEQMVELTNKVVSEMRRKFGDVPRRLEQNKDGWNLFVVNKADARGIIRGLKETFEKNKEPKLEVIRSYKLVGKKDGVELMRDFYCVR